MSNDLREILSSSMDGEATEFELRRLIRAVDDDGELADDWARMHVTRAVLRKEEAAFCDIDVSAAVMGVIHAGSSDSDVHGQQVPGKSWRQSIWGAALAASVTGMVFLAGQFLLPVADGASAVAGAASTPAKGRVDVGTEFGHAQVASQRLNQYLIRHSENTAQYTPQGLMTYTRVVVHPDLRAARQGEARPAATNASDGAAH